MGNRIGNFCNSTLYCLTSQPNNDEQVLSNCPSKKSIPNAKSHRSRPELNNPHHSQKNFRKDRASVKLNNSHAQEFYKNVLDDVISDGNNSEIEISFACNTGRSVNKKDSDSSVNHEKVLDVQRTKKGRKVFKSNDHISSGVFSDDKDSIRFCNKSKKSNGNTKNYLESYKEMLQNDLNFKRNNQNQDMLDTMSCNYCEEIYRHIIFKNVPLRMFKCLYCSNDINQISLQFYFTKYWQEKIDDYNYTLSSSMIQNIKKEEVDKKSRSFDTNAGYHSNNTKVYSEKDSKKRSSKAKQYLTTYNDSVRTLEEESENGTKKEMYSEVEKNYVETCIKEVEDSCLDSKDGKKEIQNGVPVSINNNKVSFNASDNYRNPLTYSISDCNSNIESFIPSKSDTENKKKNNKHSFMNGKDKGMEIEGEVRSPKNSGKKKIIHDKKVYCSDVDNIQS